MNGVFKIVYDALKWTSSISGLTYHEVNIIAYYFIVPAILVFLFGELIKKRIFIILFLVFALLLLVIIPDFESFSTLLFEKSVAFLNWFDVLGLNYIQASVVVCVIIPIIFIGLLIVLNQKRGKQLQEKDT